MGIARRSGQHLVYVTRAGNLPAATICFVMIEPSVSSFLDIGNPTDIVIPARDIGHNPPALP
jgi:hypothetical protein